MANLTEYLSVKFNRMIGEITKDLGEQLDKSENLLNILRALKNPDMIFAGGPLTLERIQIMENGDFRILPMQPILADTCNSEVSREVGRQNGKKGSQAIEDAVEMTEAQAGD